MKPAFRAYTLLLFVLLASTGMHAQSGTGLVRVANVALGGGLFCVVSSPTDSSCFMFGEASVQSMFPTGEYAFQAVLHGAMPASFPASIDVRPDTLSTFLLAGGPNPASLTPILLRTPLAPLQDSMVMLRVLHASPSIGGLDISVRFPQNTRMQIEALRFGQSTEYKPVLPGEISVYAYQADFASTEILLDEHGAIDPGTYMTLVITGSKPDDSLHVRLLRDSNPLAVGAMTRLRHGTSSGITSVDASRTISVVPNPALDRLIVDFSLEKPAHVKIALFDLLGRKVATLLDDNQPAGQTAVARSIAGIPSGSYSLVVTADGKIFSHQRVSIAR